MDKWLPTRYLALAIVAAAFVLALLRWPDGETWHVLAAIFGVLTAIGFVDLVQRRSTLRRNYPLLAHIRFFFEGVRPMLRQYVVESDNEEVPFSHVQRAIVKQRAKNALDTPRLVARTAGASSPSFLPDGQHVIYLASRGTARELRVASLA